MNVTAKPAVSVEMGARPSQSWKVTPDAVDMTRPAPPVRPLAVTDEPQNITVDVAKSALLIVDMQNDFLHQDGSFSHIARKNPEAKIDMPFLISTIPHVKRLADAFRAAGNRSCISRTC